MIFLRGGGIGKRSQSIAQTKVCLLGANPSPRIRQFYVSSDVTSLENL